MGSSVGNNLLLKTTIFIFIHVFLSLMGQKKCYYQKRVYLYVPWMMTILMTDQPMTHQNGSETVEECKNIKNLHWYLHNPHLRNRYTNR